MPLQDANPTPSFGGFRLKGNIGNQNYPVPSSVDLAGYRSVVIYCKPLNIVFSVAPLHHLRDKLRFLGCAAGR